MIYKVLALCGALFIGGLTLILVGGESEGLFLAGMLLFLSSVVGALAIPAIAYIGTQRAMASATVAAKADDSQIPPPPETPAPHTDESTSEWLWRLLYGIVFAIAVWSVASGGKFPFSSQPAPQLEVRNVISGWVSARSTDGGMIFIPRVQLNLANVGSSDVENLTTRVSFVDDTGLITSDPSHFVPTLSAGASRGPIQFEGQNGIGDDLALYAMRETPRNMWRYRIEYSTNFSKGPWLALHEGEVELPEPIKSFPTSVSGEP